MYHTIVPEELAPSELHQYLVTAVAPRPIAFVSTIDEDGVPNLAPYSFFNVFSSNPPIAIFSSNRRVRNNTTKDTLHNVEAVREVVINMISHSIVRQATIAGGEYDNKTNEFIKAGLTPIASDVVRPFRVAESPVQMECIVKDIISLGEHGGAGNLILCQIVRIHINKEVLNEQNKIDQDKIDLMGRLGRISFVRASGNALINIAQPAEPVGIGFDSLPSSILRSKILSGNDLALLAGKFALPTAEQIAEARNLPEIKALLLDPKEIDLQHQAIIKQYIDKEDIDKAFAIAYCL